MRLLLINPRFPESFWSFKWAIETMMPRKRAINPPLGLATLAALCPKEWHIEIIDENIESIPLAPDVDIVGICGMGVQFDRQKELLEFYRRQGLYVVAGGSFASLCPERYEGRADTVVAGEAEYIWKEFCRDYQRGRPRRLYQESGLVSLEDSPTPRFDLLRLDKYQAVSLQFSRGCPFQCEFCDIIVMFGRTPRTKSLEQVGKELDVLRKQEIHNVFFVDDNLIGNKRAAKDLLRFLIVYQRDHRYRFHFGTEASVNLAYDHELLELFRDANFGWVFLGIESPEEEALKETKKLHNVARDLLASVRTIYSYGIDVLAGFIVGFDSDTPETFDRQFRFIMRAGIQAAMIGLLTALPRTPLYERVKKEGRLISSAENTDNTKLGTNIVPKRMRYDEMVSGFQRLYERLLEDRNIASRIRNKTRHLRDLVPRVEVPSAQLFRLVARFTVLGLVPGGLKRLFHFLRSLPLNAPRRIPFVIQEWTTALALRDYTRRHFVHDSERDGKVTRRHLRVIKKAFARYLREGALELSIQNMANARVQLSLIMHGALNRHFFARTARHLKRVLRSGKLSVALRIGEFTDQECRHLQRLLRRLAPYGDRINVAISRQLAHTIDIDSSVFNLVLSS